MDNFIRMIRPELKQKTLNIYTKEYKYLAEIYEEDDPFELTSILIDIAENELNLNHVRLVTEESTKFNENIRLMVFRSLYLFFTTLQSENINLLISEIFL